MNLVYYREDLRTRLSDANRPEATASPAAFRCVKLVPDLR